MIISEKRYKYLSLIKEIALTDFKLKYQGSILGYFWSLAKPLAYFAVLYTIFTKVFKVGANIPNYPIYLLLGVLMFGFWSDATSQGMLSIALRGDLIRKVYFPRIVLVVASTLTAFITFLFNSMAVLVFAYFNHLQIGWSVLLVPVYLLEFYILVLGVSFYLAALFVKFKDISQIWEVVSQILFYATPILYTINQVPEKFARIMVLSPVAQVILDVRHSVIGSSVLTIRDYWSFPFIPHILVLLTFVSGYFVFQKMAAKFAEEV